MMKSASILMAPYNTRSQLTELYCVGTLYRTLYTIGSVYLLAEGVGDRHRWQGCNRVDGAYAYAYCK